MNTTALVIAAHPDDEVLGCGATIARMASEGWEVHILILANGLESRVDFPVERARELLEVHHERARRAGAILGAQEVVLGGFPDQRLDAVPLLEITQRIEREVGRLRPSTVFTHHGGDLNMDHGIVFRATLTALRPMAGGCCRRLLAYEVPSSTEWAFGQFAPVFQPNVFMEAGRYFPRKLEAMAVYASEIRPAPHPRSPEVLEAAARRWGSRAGLGMAEAFQLVWQIE